MHLVVNHNNGLAVNVQNSDYRYIHQIRQVGNIIRPDRIKIGGYYLYKEKHGMICIVKILECTSKEDWIGFRLMVKRVLFSSWYVPKNYVFEAGCHDRVGFPSSWHFEPGMVLLGSQAV